MERIDPLTLPDTRDGVVVRFERLIPEKADAL
jgi:hypothetical protein